MLLLASAWIGKSPLPGTYQFAIVLGASQSDSACIADGRCTPSRCGKPMKPMMVAKNASTTKTPVIARGDSCACFACFAALLAREHEEVQAPHVERGAERGDQQAAPQQLAVPDRPAGRRMRRPRRRRGSRPWRRSRRTGRCRRSRGTTIRNVQRVTGMCLRRPPIVVMSPACRACRRGPSRASPSPRRGTGTP